MPELEELRLDLLKLHSELKSWRKAGKHYGLNPAMARLIVVKNYDPGPRIRFRLGLPIKANVIVLEGIVPEGTQVISAQQCPCGDWFISNHPRRIKCFICSPYKKRKQARIYHDPKHRAKG